MALDTALKRGSALHPYAPWYGRLPLPDSSVDTEDRPDIVGAYAGIAYSPPEVPTGPSLGASAIHIGCPWRSMWPIPDGTLDPGDRQEIAFLYCAILAEETTAPTNDSDGMMPILAIFRRRRQAATRSRRH